MKIKLTNKFSKALALLFSLALTVTACKPSDDESDPSAFSNRPQNYDRFIAVLKLKNPSLLATSKKVGTDVVVDETLKTAIASEQDQLIAELNALSPDIQVLYKYKMVLNAIAIVAPKHLEDKFRKLTSVSYVERENRFERMAPVSVANNDSALESGSLELLNSVSWIGGTKTRSDLNLDGAGTSVGIIDTGIDYTHKMFGGPGTPLAFTDNNPDLLESGSFPTSRVIGGIDLVGTVFDSSSPNFAQHIPIPDNDPIDEGGHGTHVAGTVAGLGDGTETYTGVAPSTLLHAIKVFGKDGSTGDAVVIAALEYSADPNGDSNTDDRLDVVNMSLGSSYGTPHVLYTEAVENLVKGDVVVVASAGNSGGTNDYIVGAPSTSDKAISVAASIDNMDHNWKFAAVAFKTPAGVRILSEAMEASFAKPIATSGQVTGKLVYLGLAAADLTPEQKAAVKDNVAFIDRGKVAFSEKARRAAEAGAIGVVVANNVDGDAFVMGGDGSFEIPAIMITKTLGDRLKADLPAGAVIIEFKTVDKFERPELIDTLTSFSSRGPRSVDGFIKPEVAAPGSNIISAQMGAGDKGIKFSGTSMAAPHIAGVAALLKQKYPTLTVDQIKSLIVSTAVSIDNQAAVVYPIAHMGAGRVQTFEAASAKIVFSPATISLGEVAVETGKTVRKEITISNITDAPVTVNLAPAVDVGLSVGLASSLTLSAGESKVLPVTIKITPPADNRDASFELDGFIKVTGDGVSHQIPVLAVVNKTGRLNARSLNVLATSSSDDLDAASELTVENKGETAGEALIFNLLGKDGRKESSRANIARNTICDLESAGWRVLKKSVDGAEVELLQVALKLYSPVTTWHLCEASILIDGNGDGVADQELLGTNLQTLSGNAAQNSQFFSVLTDASKLRDIRRTFEQAFPSVTSADYSAAILDGQELLAYNHSSLIVVSADLSKLAKTAAGDLKVKVAIIAESTTPEGDDFLGNQDKWITLEPKARSGAFYDFPEIVSIDAGSSQKISLTRGAGKGNAVIYMPYNKANYGQTGSDAQSKVLKPVYNTN
jgi:minor extracellular serine protease Vpr